MAAGKTMTGWKIGWTAVLLVACMSCGGDDDDDDTTVDAATVDGSSSPDGPTIDAPPGTPDAPPGIDASDIDGGPIDAAPPDAPPPLDAAPPDAPLPPDAAPPPDAPLPIDAAPPPDVGVFSCPDTICQAAENCSTCPADCGECPGPGTDAGTSTCPHDECTTGLLLPPECGECAAAICSADSFCCSSSWDSICVGEVASVCGKTCP
jgi:hypothetical protein